jgi:copper chaperone CopZ
MTSGTLVHQSLPITGMTCEGCAAKVRHLLSQQPNVRDVHIDLAKGEAHLSTEGYVDPSELKALLAGTKYSLEVPATTDTAAPERSRRAAPAFASVPEAPPASWLSTYRPLLLVFGFITGISVLASFTDQGFDAMHAMRHFMAGFFLAFSFFKLLDLQGFADSYAMYDLLAKRWRGYAFIYPFIELGLGLAYLTAWSPTITAWATVIVMGFSTIGVLRAVLNKQRIQCACLGAVFNLPMSTVTIVEDLLMVAMAAAMLVLG